MINNINLPFTIQQLRILKAISIEKNFTKAAKRLFISQPSLSKQIKKLENNLSILLLERRKKIIFLTEAGKLFLQYSERILNLCEESYYAINEFKDGKRGNLTIRTNKIIDTYLLSKILIIFSKKYPKVRIKVKINSNNSLKKTQIYQYNEIYINDEIINKKKNNFVFENFIQEEFIVIIPKSNLLNNKKKKKIRKKYLYDLNFINLNSNSLIQQLINKVLINKFFKIKKFKFSNKLNSLKSIFIATNLGLGSSFVPLSLINKIIKFEKVDILKIRNIKLYYIIAILMNKNCSLTETIKFFYNEIWNLKLSSYK